jgi:hypothetical protein
VRAVETPTPIAPRVAVRRSPYRAMNRPTTGSKRSLVSENAATMTPTAS